jgi:hypothetical protein
MGICMQKSPAVRLRTGCSTKRRYKILHDSGETIWSGMAGYWCWRIRFVPTGFGIPAVMGSDGGQVSGNNAIILCHRRVY